MWVPSSKAIFQNLAANILLLTLEEWSCTSDKVASLIAEACIGHSLTPLHVWIQENWNKSHAWSEVTCR